MTTYDWQDILTQLEAGEIRSASQLDDSGEWQVNTEVKAAILDAFRAGTHVECQGIHRGFFDKCSLPPQTFSLEDNVRLVPGGSSVRHGAYVAQGVVIMPPSYVNVGAYIDAGSMVDSHVLVGTCAQIGKNVHLSAGVQIGGVLEPVGLSPVIIEDNVFIGANSIIVEGIRVCKNAVIAPGVSLTRSVSVFDCVNNILLERGSAIPEAAVVVAGTRPVSSTWAAGQGLNAYCALIVKYRDERSDAALVLEEVLRS